MLAYSRLGINKEAALIGVTYYPVVLMEVETMQSPVESGQRAANTMGVITDRAKVPEFARIPTL